MRRRAAIIGSLVLAATLATTAAPVGRTVAAPPTRTTPAHAADAIDADAVVPASHKVYMVAESVGLGARGALPNAFPPDWQVTVDGTPAYFVEQLESVHVRGRMASSPGVFGDYAVVAGGHNYPYWDPARFDRSIDSMVDTLRSAGVKHIFWVTLREVKPQYISPGAWRQVQPYYWYFPTVNEHLRAALGRHPDLTLIDWAANADRPGLTYDAIHLNSYGAAEYSNLVAQAVQQVATRLPAGHVQELDVAAAGIPADASAVALNLTVTAPRNGGYLTAYPCGGEVPEVSSLNYRRDQTVAAAAIVPVGADGKVCVYSSESTQLIVDATGSFPTGGGFERAAPIRVVDTRAGARQAAGVPLRVPLSSMPGVAADATAVALNVTATDAAAAGYVTVWPCGELVPPTSNLNVAAGGTAPNVVVARPGGDGSICVVASVDTHLLVDVFGSFAASDGTAQGAPGADAAAEPAGVHVPAPVRSFDSRAAGFGRVVAAGETVRVPVADAGAGALLTVTATGTEATGYLTAYPCDTALPPSSNLNIRAGADVANFAVLQPGATGEVCVYASSPTHVIVDVMGALGATFAGISPTRLFDSRS